MHPCEHTQPGPFQHYSAPKAFLQPPLKLYFHPGTDKKTFICTFGLKTSVPWRVHLDLRALRTIVFLDLTHQYLPKHVSSLSSSFLCTLMQHGHHPHPHWVSLRLSFEKTIAIVWFIMNCSFESVLFNELVNQYTMCLQFAWELCLGDKLKWVTC